MRKQKIHPPTKKHNYEDKVIVLGLALAKQGPGLKHIRTFHDDWCDIYKEGFCNCDCDVRVMSEDE